jgi:6-phosphogluconolactonase (cycloisomerase 2 family)
MTQTCFAYVGSYTEPERGGRGNGITVYKVDRRTGAFRPVQRVSQLENPSFLTVSQDGRHLYAVHGDRTHATSFLVDRDTGKLTVLNRQPTGGYNPVRLALDPTGRFLVVANYTTDSVCALPVKSDGSLGPYSKLTAVGGELGPHKTQQRGMYPHDIPLDPQGRFFYVPCKGGDCVISYRLDTQRRQLVETSRVAARPGAGPRHIAFHPRRPLAYVLNELDSTITTYRQDGKTGKLTPLHVVRSTPADFTAYSTGAEIAVDRAGRHAYVTNRGHDSVGVFAIDPRAGTLSPKQFVPTKGGVPRFFCFDPDERFLYVANQGGHSIIAYRVGRDGKLSSTAVRLRVGSPACIVFSPGVAS